MNKLLFLYIGIILFLIVPLQINAQNEDSIIVEKNLDTTIILETKDTSESKIEVIGTNKKNPFLAATLSAFVPGLGTIYTRANYWYLKVPIIWGVFSSVGVAFIYYRDLHKKYLGYYNVTSEYMISDKYIDIKGNIIDVNGNNLDNYPDLYIRYKGNYPLKDLNLNFKRARDKYIEEKEKYLTYVFIVYIAQIMWAYVDTHLLDFDVSEKLSMGFDNTHKTLNINFRMNF